MRYSDIENVNLGHRQISFGFENNLSQEQNAVMECLADQIKQHGHVVLSEFVPHVKETHGLSEFKILQYIFWIAQDFKIQFRINNKNLELFKVKSLLLNSIEFSEQLLIIAAETVDDSVFQGAKNLYLKITEEENIDDCDQYKLGCFLAKKIRSWQHSFQSYKPSAQKKYFPGEKEIDRWLCFIEDISTKQNSFSLISAFYDNCAQILNLYAQEKRLTEFYTKHHDFWTTLIKSVEEFSENEHELNKNNEACADFDRLKQILSSPAPYDMILEAYELLEKVRVFNDMIVKEKTDQCRIDALFELDQMIEKMTGLLDTHNAGMDLRNKALYSLRQIKTRVEKAEGINAVNLCLNDAEYIFDVLPENGQAHFTTISPTSRNGAAIMFFIDKPYVSDFFKMTVRDNAIPVVGTDIAKKLGLYSGTKVISEDRAIEIARESDNLIVYTTSENSIGWISKHLAFINLPEKIALFKDKLKFRELIKSIFPNFYFKKVRVEDLKKVQFNEMPLPFIIKPTVGFMSMGVYKVSNLEEWTNTIDSIIAEIDQIKDLYPAEVLDTSSFIIEQCINGEEFAVDAYYNSIGEPVILNILKHTFSSDTDVSDRVYISSKEIIESNLEEFTDFVGKIGNLAGVKNFPVHIELRRDNDGALLPIEVNPMRFGGWCTTADISFLAYGFNPYLYYYSQKKPNWSEVLKGKEGKLFSIIVLDNSTGIDVDEITSFNYEKLVSNFEKPIELRKIDYKKYPVFGFLFAETREDNFIELKNILDSDLNEFISTK